MLKKLREWWKGKELASFGDDLQQLGETLRTVEDRYNMLLDRFDRMQNRVGMRLARIERESRPPQEGGDAEFDHFFGPRM